MSVIIHQTCKPIQFSLNLFKEKKHEIILKMQVNGPDTRYRLAFKIKIKLKLN